MFHFMVLLWTVVLLSMETQTAVVNENEDDSEQSGKVLHTIMSIVNSGCMYCYSSDSIPTFYNICISL